MGARRASARFRASPFLPLPCHAICQRTPCAHLARRTSAPSTQLVACAQAPRLATVTQSPPPTSGKRERLRLRHMECRHTHRTQARTLAVHGSDGSAATPSFARLGFGTLRTHVGPPSVTRAVVRTRRKAHTRSRIGGARGVTLLPPCNLREPRLRHGYRPNCFCQHVEPTPCAQQCVIAEPQQHVLSENDLKDNVSGRTGVQHATQLAPEAVAAWLRSGAEAPRSRQAWPAARRPTCSCAASSGTTLQPSRRMASTRGPWPRSLSADPLGGRRGELHDDNPHRPAVRSRTCCTVQTPPRAINARSCDVYNAACKARSTS
jgi:hypothetical protein